jgi:hypothetical protein
MDNSKEESKIPVDKPTPAITKKEDGVYHDEHGKLLYTPDEEFELKSCCGSMCTVDKPFLEFLAKTVVSLSVLGFCFIQLTNGQQSEFASSTISLILGTYLGSTTSAIKDKNK